MSPAGIAPTAGSLPALLVGDIQRHLDLSATNRIVLALSDGGRKAFGELIERNFGESPRVRLLDVSAGESVFMAERPDVVVVISDTLPSSLAAFAALDGLKDAGIPVVFGSPVRRLFRADARPQGAGISYEGMFWLAAEYARTVRVASWSYCEFGVFDGRTFSLAYHAMKPLAGRFYAFDTFRGIAGSLDSEQEHFVDGAYHASEASFRYNMQYADVDLSRVETVSGDLRDTLTNRCAADYGIEAIVVAHIDVDVYQPAIAALEFMTPKLADGALILLDDYDSLGGSNKRGERKALQEWLQRHPEITVDHYRSYSVSGRSFIVQKEIILG